jgi:S-adenosyl methyltransferase
VLDTRTPSVARAYDHLLGGAASFAADRALAGRLLALYPSLAGTLIASRTMTADAVARVAALGVDQYLDLGAGLPTRPATHAVARAELPSARVVYVDRDPVVVEHAADLVPAGVRYHRGDLTEPEGLLADLAGVIDFTRPVCLVLALILQALDPGLARPVVGVLTKALAPGSYLIATAATGEAGRLPDTVGPSPLTEPDLTTFFGGLDLLPPGPARLADVVCAIGVKRHPLGGPHG